MAFRHLKTLAFDKFFKKLQHYLMFLFLISIISGNLWLFNCVPLIHLSSHFSKINITTKNSRGFIRLSSHYSWEMIPYCFSSSELNLFSWMHFAFHKILEINDFLVGNELQALYLWNLIQVGQEKEKTFCILYTLLSMLAI